MSDDLYLASGCFVFLVCSAVHWALYATMSPRLRVADLAQRREALVRWFTLLAGWEAGVLLLTALYLLLGRRGHAGMGAWIAPGLGALAGNLLPLQLAVFGVSRAAR